MCFAVHGKNQVQLWHYSVCLLPLGFGVLLSYSPASLLSCLLALSEILSSNPLNYLMAAHSIQIPSFPILLSFLVFPIPLCPLLTFSPIFYSPFLLSLFISLFFFPLLPSPFPFSHSTLFPSLLLPHTSSTLLSSPSLCPLSSLPTCTHLPLQIFSLSIRSHLIPCLSSFRHPHSFLSPNPLNFQ